MPNQSVHKRKMQITTTYAKISSVHAIPSKPNEINVGNDSITTTRDFNSCHHKSRRKWLGQESPTTARQHLTVLLQATSTRNQNMQTKSQITNPNYSSPFEQTTVVLQNLCSRTLPSRFLLISLLLLCATLWQPAGVHARCRETQPRACEAICSDDTQTNCTIRALVLLPDADHTYLASLRGVEPILKVAEQRIKSEKIIPEHIKFEWMLQDDRCDAAYSVIQAMDGVVMNCAHVIFGPVCDYPLGK